MKVPAAARSLRPSNGRELLVDDAPVLGFNQVLWLCVKALTATKLRAAKSSYLNGCLLLATWDKEPSSLLPSSLALLAWEEIFTKQN